MAPPNDEHEGGNLDTNQTTPPSDRSSKSSKTNDGSTSSFHKSHSTQGSPPTSSLSEHCIAPRIGGPPSPKTNITMAKNPGFDGTQCSPQPQIRDLKSSCPIILDIASWESTVRTKNEKYQGVGRLLSQLYHVDCEYPYFTSSIADSKDMPGVKFEYVQGLAEITVFAASLIHNAIIKVNGRRWIQRLPGHPALSTSDPDASLENVFALTADSKVKYRRGSNKLVLAADVQFASILHANAARRGIIFAIAYSEHIDHARTKAKRYLWDSDPPRPSVVVLFDFIENSRNCYRDVELHFEVHRRDPLSKEGETVFFEKGLAWPREKATAMGNVQEIEFSLEELFGTADVVNDAINKRRHAKTTSTSERRRALAMLQEGLLETLRDKVKYGATTMFPIHYITNAVGKGIVLQHDDDHGSEHDSEHESEDDESEDDETHEEEHDPANEEERWEKHEEVHEEVQDGEHDREQEVAVDGPKKA